jgi:hypothetical protein
LSASKMISEPMVRSAQIVHLSCVKISTISKQTELSFHLSLVTEYHLVCPKRLLKLWYVWRKPCTYLTTDTNSVSKWTETKFHKDPRHLEVPSGVSRTISEPTVRSAQTINPSCVKISTISKQTESSFHLSLIM